MAKAKIKKTVVRVKAAAKLPKITALPPFWSPNGIVALGQGADGRVYTWAGAEPAKWVLQEFTPPTAEEIAAHLEAQHRVANGLAPPAAAPAVEQPAPNRHTRRAIKAVSGGEAFE